MIRNGTSRRVTLAIVACSSASIVDPPRFARFSGRLILSAIVTEAERWAKADSSGLLPSLAYCWRPHEARTGHAAHRRTGDRFHPRQHRDRFPVAAARVAAASGDRDHADLAGERGGTGGGQCRAAIL